MEDMDLKQIWQQQQQQLAQALVVNKQNTGAIAQLQIQTLLTAMRPVKLFAVGVGILWILVLDGVLYKLFRFHYADSSPFFLYSALLQSLLIKLAIGVYLYQLTLIQRVDVGEPIVATQTRLARLKISTLWVTRLLILQLPLWTTFYWNSAMLNNSNAWLVFQGVITLLFTAAAIWLFVNIRHKNRHKRWFQLLFNGPEWTPILKSMRLIEQLEEYPERAAEPPFQD